MSIWHSDKYVDWLQNDATNNFVSPVPPVGGLLVPNLHIGNHISSIMCVAIERPDHHSDDGDFV